MDWNCCRRRPVVSERHRKGSSETGRCPHPGRGSLPGLPGNYKWRRRAEADSAGSGQQRLCRERPPLRRLKRCVALIADCRFALPRLNIAWLRGNPKQRIFNLMYRQTAIACLALASLMLVAQAADHPILAPGSKAPDFTLPGIDGKMHSLADYASSPVLVIVFSCNHCPIAQMYEQRISKLAADYRARGVAVVAIQPNAPEAIRVDELDSSDISDSLEEMKIRASYKHLDYTYLYDGETQQVARAYGPQATPHVFIFDQQRHLRYEGRMDNSYRTELVKTQDARNAIDALLAHKEVAVRHTGVFGCSTKWKEKSAGSEAALEKINQQRVSVEMISKSELAKLRTNPSHQMMLVDFWATWCGSCLVEFADLENTLRMYGARDYSVVTI